MKAMPPPSDSAQPALGNSDDNCGASFLKASTLPRPVAPFNLFPMRTFDGHAGLVLNGCDPQGNCNIPVCIFEESGSAFLHGFTLNEATEIAAKVKTACNEHDALKSQVSRLLAERGELCGALQVAEVAMSVAFKHTGFQYLADDLATVRLALSHARQAAGERGQG